MKKYAKKCEKILPDKIPRIITCSSKEIREMKQNILGGSFMKTIVALSLLVAGSAFAGVVNGSSFENYGKIISEEPSILTSQGVEIKVSEFCVAGDEVQTKSEVEYCTKKEKYWVQDNGSKKHSDGYWEYKCIESEVAKLTHPIKYTKATCHRELIREGDDRYLSDCTYTYAPAVLPTSYTFPVYKVTGRRGDADIFTGQGVKKLYDKTVNLPACN